MVRILDMTHDQQKSEKIEWRLFFLPKVVETCFRYDS